VRVHQKWGFGMAPVKPDVQKRRHRAVNTVLSLLESRGLPGTVAVDDISEVKGLFARSCKQDQWDWFTVWTQLGRPGPNRCRTIADDLGNLRRAITGEDAGRVAIQRERLRQAGAVASLRRFLDPMPHDAPERDGVGYIYILSTRSNPLMLKIGYTERTVEQRVKEINTATGLVEPYGVRAVWAVPGAPRVEKIVHDALAEFRVRVDREFFEISYGTALRIVDEVARDTCHPL
jgi:hypothetical protein